MRRIGSHARSAASTAASKVRGMQHGGSAVVAAQQGFSGIVNRPTTYRGIHMGESFSPELVTVTPLTRGTGNHFGPTAGSGGGGSRSVVIENIVVLDGRVIDKRIREVALDGIGTQI